MDASLELGKKLGHHCVWPPGYHYFFFFSGTFPAFYLVLFLASFCCMAETAAAAGLLG